MSRRAQKSSRAGERAGAEAVAAGSTELLDQIVTMASERAQPEAAGTARLVRLDANGVAWVRLSGDSSGAGVRARRAVELTPLDVGRDLVVLMPSSGGAEPIVLGVIRDEKRADEAHALIEARLDGESVVIEAEREIVLRCGEASITLSRDGKIRIRGADVLSRSSGGQRIQGASVRIN